jgi:hypothetical protein
VTVGDSGVNGGSVEEIGVDVYRASYRGIDGGREFWFAGGVLSSVLQNRLRLAVQGVFLRDYEDVDWIVERVRADWMITRDSFLRLIAQGANVRWGV